MNKFFSMLLAFFLFTPIFAQTEIKTETCLTQNQTEDRYASYSPDGQKILFEAKRGAYWHLYIMDANGENQSPLTFGNYDNRRPAWHPKGKKIIFESNQSGKFELFTLKINNKKIKKLTAQPTQGELVFASYAPDGKIIAVSLKESDNKSNIVLLNKKGKLIKWLTNTDKRNFYPKWSPNGKELVYFSRKETDNQDDEIYNLNVQTGEELRLTNWPKHNFCPSWSNDGKKIVYVTSMEKVRPEIYIMDVDGKNPIRLTDNENGETLPFWHPKENKILLTAYRKGNYEICELELTQLP